MKPIQQVVFDDRRGDCLAACIASILEVPLEAVPNFRAIQEDDASVDMILEADKWLRANHGKRFISIELYSDRDGTRGQHLTDQMICNRLFHVNENEYVILSGESPRKNADGSKKYHCVVGRADCWGFDVVHDPHPEGGGIVGHPYGVIWIVPP